MNHIFKKLFSVATGGDNFAELSLVSRAFLFSCHGVQDDRATEVKNVQKSVVILTYGSNVCLSKWFRHANYGNSC